MLACKFESWPKLFIALDILTLIYFHHTYLSFGWKSQKLLAGQSQRNAINSVFVPCKEGALEKAAITKAPWCGGRRPVDVMTIVMECFPKALKNGFWIHLDLTSQFWGVQLVRTVHLRYCQLYRRELSVAKKNPWFVDARELRVMASAVNIPDLLSMVDPKTAISCSLRNPHAATRAFRSFRNWGKSCLVKVIGWGESPLLLKGCFKDDGSATSLLGNFGIVY